MSPLRAIMQLHCPIRCLTVLTWRVSSVYPVKVCTDLLRPVAYLACRGYPPIQIRYETDAESFEPPAAPRRADDGSCHNSLNSAASVHETGLWSCESRFGNNNDVDKYNNGPTKHLTDGSKGSLSDPLGPKTLPAPGPLIDFKYFGRSIDQKGRKNVDRRPSGFCT
ncbi:hypothetical protein BDW62DRAFT_196193 [Aspergillus aurantiobrunneus]